MLHLFFMQNYIKSNTSSTISHHGSHTDTDYKSKQPTNICVVCSKLAPRYAKHYIVRLQTDVTTI